MIIRTEAIVLRRIAFRETSNIVTLFTQQKGKMSVLAKGARRMKSVFGSSLQPMSYTQIVFYHRPSRDLQVLSESSHVRLFHQIAGSMEKISVGLRIMELTHFLLGEEDPDSEIFQLLVDVLTGIDEAESRVEYLFYYYQLRLAARLGFAPGFDRNAVRGLPDTGGFLVFDTGSIWQSHTDGSLARAATREALYAFAVFSRANLKTIMRLQFPPPVIQEVHDLIEGYMRYHVEGAYPVRSEKVFRQLRKPI